MGETSSQLPAIICSKVTPFFNTAQSILKFLFRFTFRNLTEYFKAIFFTSDWPKTLWPNHPFLCPRRQRLFEYLKRQIFKERLLLTIILISHSQGFTGSTVCCTSIGSDGCGRRPSPSIQTQPQFSRLLQAKFCHFFRAAPSLTLLCILCKLRVSSQAVWTNVHCPLPSSLHSPFDQLMSLNKASTISSSAC